MMQQITLAMLVVALVSCNKPEASTSRAARPATKAAKPGVPFKVVGQGVLRLKPPPLTKLPEHLMVRSQKEYDKLLATVLSFVPSPVPPSRPSKDPLLKRPPIDFSKQMLVVVRRFSATCAPRITAIRHLPGSKVVIEAVKTECFTHFSMADKWSYQAVVTQRMEETPELRITKLKHR